MSKTASMFLHNVTVIDGAYINSEGICTGFSVSPRIHITGKIDEEESVVVDFSTIKKDIKKFIDDPETGIDHKLLAFKVVDKVVGCKEEPSYFNKKQKGSKAVKAVQLTTLNDTYIEADAHAVHVLEFDRDYREDPMTMIQRWLQGALNEQFPDFEIKVSLIWAFNHVTPQDVRGWVLTQAYPVTYTHGLKDSTSYGCQNIMHGHKSFIQLVGIHENFASSEYKAQLDRLTRKVSEFLDGKYLVARCNITEGKKEGSRTLVQYTSKSRGVFKLHIEQDYLILPEETTIECIVAYVADKYKAQFRELGVSSVYISEGLDKGAFYQI
ncbi:6-pyruvoyl tetrahydropterin synthase-like protein [Vibrio phage vB_VcorM_GR7B]|nr:6-pyruvoyl tetrahydropterin synthase-like protein [Vibrio phage vB_VcorM_GR7B]